MGLFRVPLMKTEESFGFIEVEADSSQAALDLVEDMFTDQLEEDGEWGSCGDTVEIVIDLFDDIEDITPKSASDGLWN